MKRWRILLLCGLLCAVCIGVRREQYGGYFAVLSAEAVRLRNPNPRNPGFTEIFHYFPDGHISVLPGLEGGYTMYWAEYKNFRTRGDSNQPREQVLDNDAKEVYGGRGNWERPDNGGSWLMSVFRLEEEHLIGFSHMEDHWYPHAGNDIAWKSIGVTRSADDGISWSETRQIITSAREKPEEPTWGGAGDCCAVWDGKNARWVLFYQENFLCMAISHDPLGAPGTWYKYFRGSFSSPGLGGPSTPSPGRVTVPGSNPSVHWNTHLESWVMVWHSWEGDIYISYSPDLEHWELPCLLLSGGNSLCWYPTVIGETDTLAGQTAKLYYADIQADFSWRLFLCREIAFHKSGVR